MLFSILTILGLFIYTIKRKRLRIGSCCKQATTTKANEDIYNLMILQQNTIETSRVQEKKRVAQELHDGVLGRMFGVRMNLDSLNKIHIHQHTIQILNKIFVKFHMI
jgi:signal transduction histidine kinase